MSNFYIKSRKSGINDAGNPVGQFEISKLKPGQGITIGNVLRRVLLADLGGTAITGITIKGNLSEFSVLNGLREDVMELILNFKKVIAKSQNSNIQIGRLNVKGPAVITAGNIQTPLELEIMNPNHYLGTLYDSSTLELDLKFEYGIGYKLAENSGIDANSGIAIDAIFMPVQKVSYHVEQLYGNSKESLIMDIETNKSLTPRAALDKALHFLITFLNQLANNEGSDENKFSNITNNEQLKELHSSIPIEELQLSVRAYNCLKQAQINTVSDLLKYSPKSLKKIKNFGQKSSSELFKILKNKLGITLK